MNFTNGYTEKIAETIRKAGIDLTDSKAVSHWVKANPQVTSEAMNQALTDVGWGVGANAFSSYLADKAKVEPVGEVLINEGLGAAFEASRRERKKD